MKMARILVVEDNGDLAAGIEHNLKLEGYDMRVAPTGPAGIAAVAEWSPELVILDLMLPGADGYEVLKSIRKQTKRVPVIILTARAEEHSKIRGFRLDADQYVTKPFGILELLERVAALLRRSAQDEQPLATLVTFGDVRVDLDSHRVEHAGVAVTLTPKAFDLLLALIRRQGKVASRAELLREVWGYGSFIMTRTVDSHIAELRRKLDDPEEPRHIVTVWKVGYRFAE
jgi:two-component system, OmpR family, alkaline phosphatase synthesis response regulator PhoP